MNITFLIGNGFDRNLGLYTNYTDFLKVYRETKEDDSEDLKWFKEEILIDEKLWSSAEEAFGKCTTQFVSCGYAADFFCECHEDFCISLAKYLQNQEKRINFIKIPLNITKSFKDSFENFARGFREEEKEEILKYVDSVGQGLCYNFISFNYTETLDKLIEILRKQPGVFSTRTVRNSVYNNRIGNLFHVHGTTYQDMILGVNDETQILDTSLFDECGEEYMEQLIKVKTNQMNKRNTDNKVFDILKSSDVIYIYGMSIGKTDALWWKRICELMIAKPNLRVIIHKYDAPQDSLIRRKFITYTKACRAEFMSHSDLTPEDKLNIDNRIFIDRTNIFEGLKGLAEKSFDSDKILD